MIRYFIASAGAVALTAVNAYAADPTFVPGTDNISMAVSASRSMPPAMAAGLAAIAGMIVITVLYAKFSAKGDKRDE